MSHFSFDTLSSLAFFLPDQLELGATAGGWYQAPAGDLSVGGLRRPPLAAAVGLMPEAWLGRDPARRCSVCARPAISRGCGPLAIMEP